MKLYSGCELARGRVAQHACRAGPRLRRRTWRCPCPGRHRVRPRARPASTGSPTHGSRRSTTGMPASRNGRAMSSARGYWFDCTPISPTSPKSPLRLKRAISAGMSMRVLVSSITSMSMLDIRAEHLPLGAVGGDAVDRGQRIRRDHRAPPADHVAVVVVVRRLDQHQLELAWRTRDCCEDRCPARTPVRSSMFGNVGKPRRTSALPCGHSPRVIIVCSVSSNKGKSARNGAVKPGIMRNCGRDLGASGGNGAIEYSPIPRFARIGWRNARSRKRSKS